MSEPIFPASGGVATMAAPAPAEPQPEKASNRKALLAVAGVVGALVVGAGAFFMLTSGAPEEDFTIPIAKPSASAPAEPSASASPGATTTVKKTNVTSRDPFAVLFPTPKAEPSAQQSGSTTDGTATQAPNQSQTTTYTVAVTDIKPAKGQATVVVNGKSYATVVGEKFAPYFTLYAVFNAECVGVLFGDQNVPVCLTVPATVTQ